MNKFLRGYTDDAGVDIVFNTELIIRPGFQKVQLDAKYTPAKGEVAFLVARSSTANKGILPIPVAIDAGYEGKLIAWLFNTSDSNSVVFQKGERAFSIVNFKLGDDRVPFDVKQEGKRGENKLGSSGGTDNGRH
jgi:dUTPase